MRFLPFLTLSCVVTMTLSQTAAANPFKYPETRRVDVTDNFHGTTVPDPYRWLEDPDAADTVKWVDQQNQLTRGFLDTVPARQALKERLTALWNYPKVGLPVKKGKRYFFSKNDGLQNQAVLYMREGLHGATKVVIDPNALSADGTVALQTQAYSEDGRYLVYGLAKSGSDREEIRIRNLDTGKDFAEVLSEGMRYPSIAWSPDGKGFYYDRYPAKGTVSQEDENNFAKVYWHQLGTAQSADSLVYERLDDKEMSVSPFATDDGQYLFLWMNHGTSHKNRLYYRPMASQGPFKPLLDGEDANYTLFGNVGGTFYVRTDKDAPRFRIVAIDGAKPEPKHWQTVVPQGQDVIESAQVVDHHLVLSYLHDAHSQLQIRTMAGKLVRDVALPGIGTLAGVSGQYDAPELFYGFTSFLFPSQQYRYDVRTGKTELYEKAKLAFDLSQYRTEQVFYTSKDGTRVPMFLTYKKGLKRDGQNPVLLYGYGGFNANMTPSFSASRLVWLEQGGVYALANIRGGAEYGEAWHDAGILSRKQNVFDDFIGAGEWLVKEKFTSPAKLAIQGGSNGGLLVAACLLQRPELFGAALCQVPVTDMLRYHKFTVGRYWIPEYGNAEKDADLFKVLYGYSPLHNVKAGVPYPATMIMTADHDDRVVPMHALKFGATLQAATAGPAPVLLRVETKAGHGAGKPTAKVIDEVADMYAFLMKSLGMTKAP